ncbi:MAG: hypothetical protein A3A88_04545 [Nitrospirae bacterium RIFCSPLOWO2_01_FULL_62_17]|nr:MAG: hypothetical protein A3A88_04545 [Nitrospirae bacterium RIFCSPLOWO2_01_FULL_62_17]
MKFLLDVCVCSRSLCGLLTDLKHDVRLALDIDPPAEDEILLDLALRENRIFVTEDKDLAARADGDFPRSAFQRN